jgi:hypothetical protein
MAVPRAGATRLALVPGSTEPGDLIIQNRRGDQHAQLHCQGLNGAPHQTKQLVAVEGELDLSADPRWSGASLGRLVLVPGTPIRIVSLRGLAQLGTGREGPVDCLVGTRDGGRGEWWLDQLEYRAGGQIEQDVELLLEVVDLNVHLL